MNSKHRKLPSNSFLCTEVQESLKSLSWNERIPDLETELRRHVEACDECGREWNTWVEMHENLRLTKTPDPGNEFWEEYQKSVAGRIDDLDRTAQPAKKSSWIWEALNFQPRYAIAAAAVLAVVFVSSRYWWQGNSVTQMADSSQETWVEFCINEFDVVAQEELFIEPLPVFAGK